MLCLDISNAIMGLKAIFSVGFYYWKELQLSSAEIKYFPKIETEKNM